MRILLAAEEVTSRPSEGLLVFTMHLCRYLFDNHDLTIIHERGEPDPEFKSFRILSGKLHFSRKLASFYDSNDFESIIYIPSSGLTSFGLLRMLLLQRQSGLPGLLIALQERNIGHLHRLISNFSGNMTVLSPVRVMCEKLGLIGIDNNYIMPGIDDRLFCRADPAVKGTLRSKYGIPEDKFIVLHVGHIKESRNLQTFLRYREWGSDIQPVIKGGEVDDSWKKRLRQAGIIVIDEYTPDVHEIYQASDLYLFPVSSRRGALEFPLSVIEAAACDLPVLTTRFGALPEMIAESEGFSYFENIGEIAGAISRLRDVHPDNSEMTGRFSWEMVFRTYLEPRLSHIAGRRKNRR